MFSESEDRLASAEDQKDFEDQVASQLLPLQQVGDLKKTDLPGLEALSDPDGKKYDYVFDVDIQDGVPPLKLSYNANGGCICEQNPVGHSR